MNPNVTTESEAPDQDQAVESLRTDITELLRTDIDAELLPEKQRQNFRLDKANKYNRGMTYIAPGLDRASGVVSWTGVNFAPTSEKDMESSGVYDYHIDITKSYGRKYTAVLGMRPFYNMKGKPKNPESEADRAASRMAELGAQQLRAAWSVRIRNIEVFARQWEAGNVYAYLSHAADEKLWGTYDEAQYEPKTVEIEPAGFRCTNCGVKSTQPAVFENPVSGVSESVCPQCQSPMGEYNFEEAQTAEVPEFVGNVTYPHAGPKLTLCTGFTVTEPFDTTADNRDDMPLMYEYEAPKGALIRHFGEKIRKKLNDRGELQAGGEKGPIHQQGEITRAAAASLRASSVKSSTTRWTFTRYWIPASTYETMPKPSRELATELYPEGMKVSLVEGIIIDIENENKSDHWEVFTPEPGEYLYKDPVCYGILPLQDITNDTYNLLIATLERGMPSHLMDPEVIDHDRMREENRMLEVLWAKPGVGRRLEDSIATIPSARFPDGAFQVTGGIEGIVQQHTGLLPAAWGGQSGNKTAEQARADLNQALMQLSVPGEFATAGWVGCFTKGVKLWAKYGKSPMSVGGEDFDFDVLRAGNWYFEGDIGVPMSWSEMQQRIELIIGQNPQMAHALGLDLPINMPTVRDQLLPGMNELRVPGEDARNRILGRVRAMLSQQPIQGANGMESSIQPDPDLDDAAMDGDLVKQWLNSPQGLKAQQDNPMGFANVKLHLVALRQLGMQQAPPPDQQQPGESGGGNAAPPPPPPTQAVTPAQPQ